MDVEELAGFGLPKKVLDVLKDQGIRVLFEPQELAINKGLLDLENNFLVSVPTASGKTLIAELFMIKALLQDRAKGSGRLKCLYIVPLRALAAEKLSEFRKWEALGFKVGMSTGDLDSKETRLAAYDIIVATSEKVDSLTRHGADWIRDVGVMVVDEVHLVHDPGRGPTLEVVMARMRHLNPGLLILALSATVRNALEIAHWLDASLIDSDWRPVEHREGVYYDGSILFNNSRLVDSEAQGRSIKEVAAGLALETIDEGGQALVFLNTRRSVESFADGLAPPISPEEKDELEALSERILKSLPNPTKTCIRLSKAVKKGAAFHHAGLLSEQRHLVEKGFKKRLLKVLSATPTLAAGVNLPARRVIIKDYQRYDSGVGQRPIPVLEYKQMAGRAGRPGYDPYGEAILIARTDDEKDFLLDNYVLAEPEEIDSKLAMESALRTHVLSTISSNFANTLSGLLNFFSKTLFAHQRDVQDLEDVLEHALLFLEEEGLIENQGKQRDIYVATDFGRRVAELYLDPYSAVMLRDSLFEAEKKKTREISWFHAMARTGELGGLYLRKGDFEKYLVAAYEHMPYLLTALSENLSPWDQENLFAELKMASFLTDWVHESDEEELREGYNVAPGDIRSKVEIARWLIYSMAALSRLFRCSRTNELWKLQARVQYGVKEELLELVSLRGIGRVRARKLFSKGLKTIQDIREAPLEKIAGIESIGEKLANSIKEQAEKKEK